MTLLRRAALLVGLLLCVSLLLATQRFQALELPLRDRLLRALPQKPSEAAVVVAIDEESLRSAGAWPWPRETLARIVERVAQSGARGVVLDVVLSEPRAGDTLLAAAASRLPVVCVAALDEGGRWLLPNDALKSVEVAHGHFELDGDGILRRIASTKQSRERSLPALSTAAATLYDGRPIEVGATLIPSFRTRPRSVPRVSAATLLQAPLPLLRGRVVFVGPTALALGDRVLTPTSIRLPDPGVTVHAAATESLVRGEMMRPLPPVGGAVILMAVAVALATRMSLRRRVLRCAAIVAVAPLLALFSIAVVGVALPLVMLLLTAIASTVIAELLEMHRSSIGALAAARRMELDLGISDHASTEVAPRLGAIAEQLAARRLEDADAKRMLAHELKTPLASMRNLTQLMTRFELTEAERQRVGRLLEEEAGKLQSLVASLLELERISLRSFDETARSLDLDALVTSRVAFLQAQTSRRIAVDTRDGIAIRGDAVLLERVIDNLIGNALKYTPQSAAIIARLTTADAQALLEIEDSGPGIPEEERRRIFSRFTRGSTARGTEGLGLGLSMVAEIVQWHRGSIELAAVAGGGTLFRIALPLEESH